MFRSVGVQVVVYHNEPAQLHRLAEGIAATIAQAKEAGVERVSVRFGDCAEPATIATMEALLRPELDGVADNIEFVDFGANLGSAGGSNALATGRDDEVIWVLNPDTYPSPTCLVELLEALAQPDVGAVDGRQIPIEHPKDHHPATGDTSWASGACLMFRREAFDQVGGFDDHFFPMYCDDVDISWRLKLEGWRVVHAPRAVVFHDKRITVGDGIEVSGFERMSGTLARLLLTRRYGRPDLEAETLDWISTDGAEEHRAAAEKFRLRVADGDVPTELAGAIDVAQFIEGEYALHRFRHTT